jgi:hypothetical protein
MQQNMAIQTKGPIYKISDEDLLQFVEVGGERQPIGFSKKVVWVAESHTELEYHHGDKLLKKCAYYNDYYGFLTSIDHKVAKEFAESFGITRESSLILVSRTVVELTPYLETEQQKIHNTGPLRGNTRHFDQAPNEWLQRNVPEQINSPSYRIFRTPVVLASEITWSSKNTPEENLALAEALKRRFPCEDFGVAV